MSWNNVSLGAAILQSEITGSGSDWSKVTTYLNSKCTSDSQYYCEASWGSARYNTTMQLAALVTSKYSAQSGKDYSGWCKAQMAMILGNKPQERQLCRWHGLQLRKVSASQSSFRLQQL